MQTVADVMSRDVITVGPETPIHKAAQLMTQHGISGLPVVDAAGTVVGIVSEGDLILRQKPRERAGWWRLFFEDGERLARDYRKAVGTTVAEVMTTAVISISPDVPIASAAFILDKHRVRRLPVIRDGGLVGIVSRGDLVKALAAAPARELTVPDAVLISEMRERMARELWVDGYGIVVQARDGRLSLWGIVAGPEEKAALETMARAIEGCHGVDNHLTVRSELPYHYAV
jgi:CBS domain-containing protein